MLTIFAQPTKNLKRLGKKKKDLVKYKKTYEVRLTPWSEISPFKLPWASDTNWSKKKGIIESRGRHSICLEFDKGHCPFKHPTGLSLWKSLITISSGAEPIFRLCALQNIRQMNIWETRIISACFYYLFSFFSTGYRTSKTCLTLTERNVCMRNTLAYNHSILLE